jgi:hypothetical protein
MISLTIQGKGGAERHLFLVGRRMPTPVSKAAIPPAQISPTGLCRKCLCSSVGFLDRRPPVVKQANEASSLSTRRRRRPSRGRGRLRGT